MSKLSFNTNVGLMKRLFVIIAIILICTAFLPASSVQASFNENDFETTDFNVKLNVNKNASIYISEDIKVDIYTPMHGIYRYIPLSRKIDYKAGGSRIQQSYAAMKISDVSVADDEYKAYRQRGNEVIRIGDENKTLTGKKKYSLSYRVSLYEDEESHFDTFYYNVLPNDWNTAIQNSKITLVMPKEFQKSDVSIMAGREGSNAYSSRIKWKKKGNTITIKTEKTLPTGCGITVGIKLPEGYFEDAATHTMFNIIMYLMGILFIAAMLLLWYKFGRDPKNIQTVEFYPPEDVTSAEVGYIIDGHVDKQDVVSLLFYFAQKGLISISEEGKNDYVITKEEELPPTAKTFERVFYNGLFESGDTIRLSELQDTFYDAFQTTKEMVEAEYDSKSKKIFHGTANIIRILLVLIPPIAAAVFGWMIWRTYGSMLLLFASALIVLLVPASYVFGIFVQDKTHILTRPKKMLFSIISLAMAAVAMLATIWLSVSVMGNWIMAILYAAVIGIGYFTTRFMRSRTKYGAELLGQLLGFKEFIRVAEKDRLEKLVEENPQYFYDILPYAYVMGLSKKWSKKFEGIAVEKPQWYRGSYSDTVFNTWLFYGMFNSFSRYAGATITTPSVDERGGFGGGSSGGGFSVGGGFGGGGGGGW